MSSIQINLPTFQEAISQLSFGKNLPTATYLVWDSVFPIPLLIKKIVEELKADYDDAGQYNVVKLHSRELKISLRSYPDFFENPHPALVESLTINLVTGQHRRTTYTSRLNPPILHRKETLIPGNHPSFPMFAALTHAEENAGLYDHKATIGFLLNWRQLLLEKGLTFRGHRLVKDEISEKTDPVGLKPNGPKIDRHKTALSRSEFSKPVKTLIDSSLITPTCRILDYGCGLGDDIRGLTELGYAARGWDPYYAPYHEIEKSDVVNLGFILNVIEDPAERIETLVTAWNLAERLLVVSVLISGQESYSSVKPYNDGVITNRNTFQKHFEQEELSGMIENALHAEPISVGLGICYVFRSISDQQDFLSERTRRHINWDQVNTRLRALRPKRLKPSVYEQQPELLDAYWKRLLELGRTPLQDEFDRFDEIRSLCKSANQATDLFVDKHGDELLDAARQRRREDLLVYLAGGEFQKRRTPFAHLSKRLKTDLKCFFGTYASACDEARQILFSSGDSDLVEEAIGDLEFGWFDASEGHFTIHRSFISDLPPILRIYIECAARLYGDPQQADLIKIHVYSGKLTFQHYLDFEANLLPQLEMRIKVDLRRQFVSVVDHSHGPRHQILFFKERFLGPDFPGLKQIQQFSSRLRNLGLNESHLGSNDQGAPSKEEFDRYLEAMGLTPHLVKKRKNE